MVSEVLLGGRVGDSMDRRAIAAGVAALFGEHVTAPGFDYAAAVAAPAPAVAPDAAAAAAAAPVLRSSFAGGNGALDDGDFRCALCVCAGFP